MIKIINILILIFLMFPASLFSVEKKQDISTKTAVIFNTLCATCHEGQCSGRLSLETGSEAVSSHIKRYAGSAEVSKNEVDEFFALLSYMKKDCVLVMPDNKKFKPEALYHFVVASHDSFFIPLGTLKIGDYVLAIKVQESISYRVEVISTQLELSLDQTVLPCIEEQSILFSVKERSNYFLRIRSRNPLHISRLEITKLL